MNLKLDQDHKYWNLYSAINEFKKGYQPRTNTVKDEQGDLVTDSHSILARWRKNFSLLLNVLGINYVRQTEIQTAQPLMPQPLRLRWPLKS